MCENVESCLCQSLSQKYVRSEGTVADNLTQLTTKDLSLPAEHVVYRIYVEALANLREIFVFFSYGT